MRHGAPTGAERIDEPLANRHTFLCSSLSPRRCREMLLKKRHVLVTGLLTPAVRRICTRNVPMLSHTAVPFFQVLTFL